MTGPTTTATAPADDGVEGEDEGGTPRWAKLGLACVVALAVGVFLASFRDSGTDVDTADPSPTIGEGTLPTGHPSLDGASQFDDMTLSQLEAEVADESAPVALRLTLAERYLATGDVHEARAQARLARAQASTDVEQQRALRDLGWALALLDRPQKGARLLDLALQLEPGERNATWYLANVRLSGLDDPAGAAELFQDLLDDEDLAPEQRELIEQRLTQAEAAATNRDSTD